MAFNILKLKRRTDTERFFFIIIYFWFLCFNFCKFNMFIDFGFTKHSDLSVVQGDNEALVLRSKTMSHPRFIEMTDHLLSFKKLDCYTDIHFHQRLSLSEIVRGSFCINFFYFLFYLFFYFFNFPFPLYFFHFPFSKGVLIILKKFWGF